MTQSQLDTFWQAAGPHLGACYERRSSIIERTTVTVLHASDTLQVMLVEPLDTVVGADIHSRTYVRMLATDQVSWARWQSFDGEEIA